MYVYVCIYVGVRTSVCVCDPTPSPRLAPYSSLYACACPPLSIYITETSCAKKVCYAAFVASSCVRRHCAPCRLPLLLWPTELVP